MEDKVSSANHPATIMDRLLPAVVPVLLTSIGYVDPGKWAAIIDGGARFGFDLVALLLIFNCSAILCQYLSARIGVVTRRNLAEICSYEYDNATCILLGVQTEVSVIALDITMVLGIAHGLNMILGLDLLTSVIFTGADVFICPLFANLLENFNRRFVCIYLAGLVLFFYVLGVLVSQAQTPLSTNGMTSKLTGESLYALMSLLGTSISPHNFYLYSSIVQKYPDPKNVSKDASCHDHLFAILTIFIGMFIANFMLMNSAATEFYSIGLGVVNFQDAMSLMDQVFRNPIAEIIFLLVLLICNQITAWSWKFSGEVVLNGFFKFDIPTLIHRASVRSISIIIALYCIWNSGAEGLYQLLIFAQVIIALILPSSVIPLFRVATSRTIMGAQKISQTIEYLALITFIGILGLNVIFAVEMVFGSSDWVSNLRWNMGNNNTASYFVLLSFATVSLCLLLWLAATPLKSASAQVGVEMLLDRDVQNVAAPESSFEIKEKYFYRNIYSGDEPDLKLSPPPSLENTVDCIDLELPETIIDPDPEPDLISIDQDATDMTFSDSSVGQMEELSSSLVDSMQVLTPANDVPDSELLTPIPKTETVGSVEKIEKNELNLDSEKYDDEVYSWEHEETPKVTQSQPLGYDGPGSFKSLNLKHDEFGSGTESLSRLAGLGRAARRQLAGVLDEFWGQLYDFHGQPTHEARAKRIDVLFGGDSKPVVSPLKVDITGYFPSVGCRGSEFLINSSLYDSPKQQRMMQGGMDSSYATQRETSSMWSNHLQLLDANVQNSNRNVLESGERRYASLRVPPSSGGWGDHQPMTVHGYQISSFISRTAQEKNPDYLNNDQMEITPRKNVSAVPTTNFGNSRSFNVGQKQRNGTIPIQPPGFENHPRNSPLHSQRSYYGAGNNSVISENTKKYFSLPDISGIAASIRDLEGSDKNTHRPIVGLGSSTVQPSYDHQSLYKNNGFRAGVPLGFDKLSPSKVHKDPLSLQFNSGSEIRSMWSRQPFEQFGVAEKTPVVGPVGANSNTQDATTALVDVEVKLLTSFRHCISKLLQLEGSEWLFKQNDGVDEELVDRVAERERFLSEIETREMNREGHGTGPGLTKSLVSSVPHCGEGCVWRVDLITSFGVWCIHRILDLSLMESRPELWGKYTYVLNRLQGIIDLAFTKPRTPSSPCFCLQVPTTHQQRSSPPVANSMMLPPASKPGKGKCTNASTLLDIVKDVEIAISCRKGRTGTAAGDVAFPKGKENLASVLKRYKRRLSNKLVGITHESVSGSAVPRKVQASTPYGV